MDYKLAGCVILYNPDNDVIRNVASYIDYIDCLYVVDNGNGSNIINELQEKYVDKIVPVRHLENMGIAYSLNEVINLAKNKYDLLLTMDQDSCFYRYSMKVYKTELAKFDWEKTLGIGPSVVNYNFVDKNSTEVKWGGTIRLITSGNIISVNNAINIGKFNEQLFIDEVDYDFCYKGVSNGLKMYVNLTGVYLLHSLGNTFTKKILWHTFYIMNHNKIRKYYIFRNRLVIAKSYWKVIGFADTWKEYLKGNMRLVFDVIFFENDKIAKIKYMSLGLYDFMIGKLGKRF